MINKTNTLQNNTHDVVSTINQDVKNSVLIVSVVVNMFVLTAWVTMQVTTQYDAQLLTFLFAR